MGWIEAFCLCELFVVVELQYISNKMFVIYDFGNAMKEIKGSVKNSVVMKTSYSQLSIGEF